MSHTRPTGCRSASVITLPLLTLGVVSCSDALGPSETFSLPDVREYVVGEALASLDESGHFRLPEATAPGDQPIIDLETAGELALAFIRTFVSNPNVIVIGTSFKDEIERIHGMPVDWDRVELSPRRGYWAESYLPVLPESIPGYVQRSFGPQFLIPIGVDGRQVVAVSVAAYATDLWIDSTGFVRMPMVAGGEFWHIGVPHDQPTGLPVSPEGAVRFAANETGAKIREVPVLVRPGHRVDMASSRWRLELDREIDFVRLVDGVEVRTSSVYVGSFRSVIEDVPRGWHLRLFVPADSQPENEVIPYHIPGDPDREIYQIEVPIRSDIPVDLHEVIVAGK
jgi:hypothetical protein